jgi:hypothetical protein
VSHATIVARPTPSWYPVGPKHCGGLRRALTFVLGLHLADVLAPRSERIDLVGVAKGPGELGFRVAAGVSYIAASFTTAWISAT